MTSVPSGMDTVTLYLGRDRLIPVLDFLIQAAPRRVIFNPGTESWEATTPFPPPLLRSKGGFKVLHPKAAEPLG